MPHNTLRDQLLQEGQVYLSVRAPASKTQVKQENAGRFKLDVAAPPTQDKANREIARYLSALVGTQVAITKGRRSSKKVAALKER